MAAGPITGSDFSRFMRRAISVTATPESGENQQASVQKQLKYFLVDRRTGNSVPLEVQLKVFSAAQMVHMRASEDGRAFGGVIVASGFQRVGSSFRESLLVSFVLSRIVDGQGGGGDGQEGEQDQVSHFCSPVHCFDLFCLVQPSYL